MLYFVKRFFTKYLVGVVLCAPLISDAHSYRGVVDDIESRVEQERPQYEAMIAANKKESLKYEEGVKKAVKRAESAFKKHALNLKIDKKEKGGIIDKIIQNAKNLDAQKRLSKSKGLIVFASFSMPKELLLSYHKQVQLYGGRLVMRGLIDNSFKKTIAAMDSGNGQTLVMDINPGLFKDHRVRRVPTILLDHQGKSDKFTGSVSLKYALEEASSTGDCKELALSVLAKHKNYTKELK